MARNSYDQLPMPQRGGDIVAEAKRRLAAQNGKPSMLPAMIAQVEQQMRLSDTMSQEGRASGGAQMPNNMDKYIDRVLEMGGMTEQPEVMPDTDGYSPTPDGEDAPVPYGPDDAGSEVDYADGEITEEDAAALDAADEEGIPFGQILAGIAGVGGLGAAAMYLKRKYDDGVEQRSAADMGETTQRARKGPRGVSVVDPTASQMTNGKQGSSSGSSVATVDTPRESTGKLAARPDNAVLANESDVVDDFANPRSSGSGNKNAKPGETGAQRMINETLDETSQSDIETGSSRPSTQRRYDSLESRSRGGPPSNNLDARMMKDIAAMPIRDAVRTLREAGIELTPEVMRALAGTSNANKAAARAASGAVERSIRTSM